MKKSPVADNALVEQLKQRIAELEEFIKTITPNTPSKEFLDEVADELRRKDRLIDELHAQIQNLSTKEEARAKTENPFGLERLDSLSGNIGDTKIDVLAKQVGGFSRPALFVITLINGGNTATTIIPNARISQGSIEVI